MLRQTDKPNQVRIHVPPILEGCGSSLSAEDTVGKLIRRQVFDLPAPPPPELTEHQAQTCRCADCGSLTPAEFPEETDVPVQYGPNIAAIALYLHAVQFLLEQRLAEVFRQLFEVRFCPATLAGISRKGAQRWTSFTHWVRDLLLHMPEVKHLDETGSRLRAIRNGWAC